jgi:hypothetical protein
MRVNLRSAGDRENAAKLRGNCGEIGRPASHI